MTFSNKIKCRKECELLKDKKATLINFTVATIDQGLNIPIVDVSWASNVTSIEKKCHLLNDGDPYSEDGGCLAFFDSVLCWPKTPPATEAVLQCFAEYGGVKYDSTQNATRYCHLDSRWDNYTNYDKCHLALDSVAAQFEPVVELPTIIYYTGYSISLISLCLAVIVFVHFKDLRCLRNTIHANLFITYILSGFLWILTLTLQITIHPGLTGCIVLVILFQYFSLTNFFWMLVEGLYLYMLVVQTFSSDNLRLSLYAMIGWGFPLILTICWVIAKGFHPVEQTDHLNKLEIECSYMRESHIDWIIQGPSCAVVIINLLFLIRIMWVLITKLRSANTIETRQYRKASKALLVLIPLLGITYLVVITGPESGVLSNIFAVVRATLLSTQGFAVSLFFCFLNSDVRQTLRHRYYRWRDERNLGIGNPKVRRHTMSKDYSRTESIRLTTTTPLV